MKKILAVILTLALALTAGLALAEHNDEVSEETRPYYDIDEVGIKLFVDGTWEEYARNYDVMIVTELDYAEDGSLNSGMMLLMPAEYVAEDNSYDIGGGMIGVGLKRRDADTTDYGAKLEGYEPQTLDTVEDYEFTMYRNTGADYSKLDDADKAMVAKIIDTFSGDYRNYMELSAPASRTELNTLIHAFKAKDINGNDVDESILKNAPYTMIDVWATYCSPCINEMPELGELAREYAGRVQVVGIVSDAMDDDTIELARTIAGKSGVEYTNLVPNAELYTSLLNNIQYTPTKLIVDQQGVLVGDAIIGQKNKEYIKAVFDALPPAKAAADDGGKAD